MEIDVGVVETSDIEEQELLAAQRPNYHKEVWGKKVHLEVQRPLNPSISDASVDLITVRTPQKRALPLCSQDPSPEFARLSLSLSPTLGDQSISPTLSVISIPKPAQILGDTSLSHSSQDPSNIPLLGSPNLSRRLTQCASGPHSVPAPSPDPISFLSPIAKDNYSGHAQEDMEHNTRSSNPFMHPRHHDEHTPHASSQSNSSGRSLHSPPSPTVNLGSTMSTDLTDGRPSRNLWNYDLEIQTEDTSWNSPIARVSSPLDAPDFRPESHSPPPWSHQLLSQLQGEEKDGSRRASSPLTPPPTSPGDGYYSNPGLTLNECSRSRPADITPDTDLPYRKYSLRNRSAKQLNPFQYDKRLYTRLLKGVPEAIVKDPNQGRHRRGNRYEEEDEGMENFEADPENEEEEEQWHLHQKRKEERQRRQERQKVIDARLREMGIVFLSDDEGNSIGDIAINDHQAKPSEKRGKKRKRMSRPRAFPMQIPIDNGKQVLNDETISSTDPLLKSRPRPRPVFRKRSTMQFPSQSPRAPDSIQPQLDYDLALDADQGGYDDWPADEERAVPDRSTTNSGSDRSLDELRGRKRLKQRIPSGSNDSDIQILDENPEVQEIVESQSEDDESTSEDETARDKITRTRMKILKRMMPAVLSNKLLAQAEQKERKLHHRGKDDQSPLRPGHGRKRIRSPSSDNPKRYEIRGDVETESEDDTQTEHEVIVIDGDNEEEYGTIGNSGMIVSEEDIGQPVEESEDGLDAGGIHTWLEPLPEDEPVSDATNWNTSRHRRQGRRINEPRGGDLIDRMLQRTRRVGSHAKIAPRSRVQRKEVGIHQGGEKKSGHRSGHGLRLKQAKLSFPIVRQQKRDRPDTSGFRGVQDHKTKHSFSIDDDVNFFRNLQETVSEPKKKAHKVRGAPQNIYINQHKGQQITSGRPRRVICIDIHDDNFHNALAPEQVIMQHSKSNGQYVINQISRLHHGSKHADSDDFVVTGELGPRPRIGKISLDSDMSLLPSGISLGLEGYLGKGRLYELLTFLKGGLNIIKPASLMLPDLLITPDASIEQMSASLASACDMIYNASVIHLADGEYLRVTRSAETIMHTVCHLATYKVLQDVKENADIFITTISEQLHHLIGRIEQHLELVSADGFSLNPRSFSLYWFALEVRIRIIHALKQSNKEITRAIIFSAEQDIVLLLCRLLEYGFERTVGELQKEGLELNTASQNIRVVECWISAFYVSPFVPLSSPEPSAKSFPHFWKFMEMALCRQSNMMDGQLFQSERNWRTVFGLCSLSQFSTEGISTSAARLEPYWPIVRKALQCIRLTADSKLDTDKPISVLYQRDAYVRLVTARCLLLSERWNWKLDGAEDVFRELCSIFRSRSFSNLLGEPNDFPLFIREKDENKVYEYECADTAYSLFLKLTVRAAKEFNDTDSAGRRQVAKLTRLLSLVVPVGSPPFTKENPPMDQALSMLYNRYSAIFVAIYANPLDIRSRIQQACRYITFRDADADSRTATIRGVMHIAILLRHLDKPLDDILQWVSDMIDDLITELHQAADSSQAKEEVVLMLQLIIGTLRSIILTPALKGTARRPARYPDIALLQVWMSRLILVPLGTLVKDHRTGDEMCKCIQAFLNARRSVIPANSIVPPISNQQQEESQEDYGNLDLDLEDPTLLALLDNSDQIPDENHVADQKASEILYTFSQAYYACLYQHLSCNILGEGPYYEADAWIKTWIGVGEVLVRHGKREWHYYFQLAESAWKDITNLFRRTHVRQQLTLSILCVDPTIYKSYQIYILTLWLETLASPEITIQPEFTALLFNVDGLRHVLLRQMPCESDETSGLFNLSKTQYLILRLQFIRQILINISTLFEINQEECYLSFLQALLFSFKSYTAALGNGPSQRIQDYATFRCEVCSYLRTHPILLQNNDVQGFLTWADTV